MIEKRELLWSCHGKEAKETTAVGGASQCCPLPAESSECIVAAIAIALHQQQADF